MTKTYTKKIVTYKNTDNSASPILDASPQSESLQRKADLTNNAAQRAESPRPNNTGMPDNLKSGIESLSGFSMDDVHVHYNSSKPATVQALAYTQGTDIHVAPGQEKCLPHEAWHVAQQMAGRVSPTTNINGMPLNDNATLEHEADVMGAKAVSQRKENVEIKSQNVHGGALQLKPGGNNDMVCAADVLYRDDSGVKHHVKGVGCNNPDDAGTVLSLFESRNLNELANGTSYDKNVGALEAKKKRIDQAIKDRTTPTETLEEPEKKIISLYNPAGQCAEPHAFADALKKNDNIKKGNILDVFISESVIRKKEKKRNVAIPSEAIPPPENSTRTYSRCATCAKWIQENGHVKPSFFGGGGTDEAGIRDDDCSKENLQVLKKYDHYDEITNKIIVRENAFHYFNFFESNLIPDWFKKDKAAEEINGRKNIRTVIRKQMLKNRAIEIIESDWNLQYKENEKKFHYCSCPVKGTCYPPEKKRKKTDNTIPLRSDIGNVGALMQNNDPKNVTAEAKAQIDDYRWSLLSELEICQDIDKIAEKVKESRWADVLKSNGLTSETLTKELVKVLLGKDVSDDVLAQLKEMLNSSESSEKKETNL